MHLICVVESVVHEPSDYARLANRLITQKDQLILGQWIGVGHLANSISATKREETFRLG